MSESLLNAATEMLAYYKDPTRSSKRGQQTNANLVLSTAAGECCGKAPDNFQERMTIVLAEMGKSGDDCLQLPVVSSNTASIRISVHLEDNTMFDQSKQI